MFGWKIRWQGPAINDGLSIHVGNDENYLAIYTPKSAGPNPGRPKNEVGNLNHVGIVVDDLDAVEAKITALGYEPTAMLITSRAAGFISMTRTASNSRWSVMFEVALHYSPNRRVVSPAIVATETARLIERAGLRMGMVMRASARW